MIGVSGSLSLFPPCSLGLINQLNYVTNTVCNGLLDIGYLGCQKRQGHKEVRVSLSSQKIHRHVIIITYVLYMYQNFQRAYVFCFRYYFQHSVEIRTVWFLPSFFCKKRNRYYNRSASLDSDFISNIKKGTYQVLLLNNWGPIILKRGKWNWGSIGLIKWQTLT